VTGGPSPAATPRIDSHQHFWDVESGRYAWPTPAEGPIHRTFTPADLEPELVRSGIEGTVLVQTVDTLDDTDAMLAVASANPFVCAVVGWLPLEDIGALEASLDARPDVRLVGVRHLIHHEADRDWLVRPSVSRGLGVLARRGLTFDVVAVFPDHVRLVPIVADRHPDLRLVIDHLGNPPFRRAGWTTWVSEIRAAAARPNVAAKLSGLDTAAGDGWTDAELRPAIDVALEAFGPARLMFGSDWPVCRVRSTYAGVVQAMERAVGDLSPAERAAIMGGTAVRRYRVPSGR